MVLDRKTKYHTCMSNQFFENLKGFSVFDSFLEDENYEEAPLDWWVVITDVIGSTKAIEAGRYKEVNTIGAGTLAALQNAIPSLQFPFVFGGDGASALIPSEYKVQAERELSALRKVSKEKFGLALRVGMISVKELVALEGPVQVAKFLLEGNYPLAVFRGGALSKAEEQIKGFPEKYEVKNQEGSETDLRKLSCRWKPLKASHGRILSLLFSVPNGNLDVYRSFLERLDQILDHGTAGANPVHDSRMEYRGFFNMLGADRKYQRSFWSSLPRLIDTFFAFLLFNLGLYKIVPGLRRYVKQTGAHSDFRKFDDMLRMVLDCSEEQASKVEELCKEFRESHGVSYGIHLSSEALMTCYVPGFSDGAHIHFIDGGDGGYAVAAKQLKAQFKAQSLET